MSAYLGRDVYADILSRLTQPRDLLNARLVSREFRDIAESFLYGKIQFVFVNNVYSTKRAQEFYDFIEKYKPAVVVFESEIYRDYMMIVKQYICYWCYRIYKLYGDEHYLRSCSLYSSCHKCRKISCIWVSGSHWRHCKPQIK